MTIQHDFSGRVALVSGAASGIGRASAHALAVAGAHVLMADIDRDRLEESAAAVRNAGGGHVSSIQADVTDPQACEAMVAQATTEFGGLHIAVNNAGVPSAIGGEFEDTDIKEWQRLIDTNLSAVFYAMKAEVPALKAGGGGAIVNTASVASLVAAQGMAAYVASKHGVGGLTKAAALDLIQHNIRVNAVCPGLVDTAMLTPALNDPETFRAVSSQPPIARIAGADEIAACILFLASEASSYLVGELLTADGGVTIR